MEAPKLENKAKMLLIHIDENDLWRGHSLYEGVVRKLRDADMAGATVYRGILGYGAHHRVHRSGIFGMSNDLPVMISVIDTEEKIRTVLPILKEMITEGLVVMLDAEVILYSPGNA